MNGANLIFFLLRFMGDSMSEFQKILKAQSQRPDQQFYQVYPSLTLTYVFYPLSQPNDEPSSSHYVPPDIVLQPTLVHMDSRSQSKPSQSEPNISTEQGNSGQIIIPQRQQSQMEALQQSSLSEYVVTQPGRNQRRTQTYETNNLLPLFRNWHIKFLRKRLGKKINSNMIIKKWRKSNTANKDDYRELYNNPDFYETFEEFFGNKVLYRAVMASKCQMKNKKIFIRKLHIFQDAYRTKIFNRVNRREIGNMVQR